MQHRAPLKEQEEMEEKKIMEETMKEDKGGELMFKLWRY